jgi:hypothetical protein
VIPKAQHRSGKQALYRKNRFEVFMANNYSLLSRAFMFILLTLAISTGFAASWETLTESNFNLGTYENTSWSVDHIKLDAENTTGLYTSQIFDAGSSSSWDSIYWAAITTDSSSSEITLATYVGSNLTQIFDQDDNYYLADMKDITKRVYISFSNNLTNNTLLKIYMKKNKGVTIGIYDQADTDGTNPFGTVTVTSTIGDWYNITLNIDTPTDSLWLGEGTGSGADPKDEFDYIFAESYGNNISYQVRSCDDASCDVETWSDELPVSNNQYFQYKAEFTSDEINLTPELYNITVGYTILNSAPTITLNAPTEGDTYGYNETITLSYSAADDDANIDTCWYNVDEGDNITLPSCANNYFNTTAGAHTLYVFVNDTDGEEVSDSNGFTITLGAPTISLYSPIDVYLSEADVEYNYSTTDLDLDSCELWGNFTGAWDSSQTDKTVTSGEYGQFNNTLSDGIYMWNIWCNDTVGNSAFNGNKTFYLDTTAPVTAITEPTDTHSSKTNIPLEYTATDLTNMTCAYNVTFAATGSEVIADTSIENCTDTTFSVDTDSDYTLILTVTDSATNVKIHQTNFTVDTTTDDSGDDDGSGGGGGGGGGGGAPSQTANTTNETEEECVEKWSCSDWYKCVNDSQARTCVDINKCDTTANRPTESRTCIAPHCSDKIWNFDEDSVDCGGKDCDKCDMEVKGLTGSLIELDPSKKQSNTSFVVIIAAIASVFVGIILIVKEYSGKSSKLNFKSPFDLKKKKFKIFKTKRKTIKKYSGPKKIKASNFFAGKSKGRALKWDY